MNKYSLSTQIKERRGQKQFYIHPYANLGGVSKGFYIKGCEVNFIISWVYHSMNLNVKISSNTIMDIILMILTDTQDLLGRRE